MPQERSEAVVLRGVDFSESSRIVTFLSPERGRLSCMAKGARRHRSPLQAVLDTLNRVEIVYFWKDSRSIQQLGEVALLDGFGGLKADLDKASFAALPLEFALRAAHENEPSHAVYAVLVGGMESLSAWRGDVRLHASWQLAQLLAVSGFEPALDACSECGTPLEHASGFSYSCGVTCAACRRDRRIDADEFTALRTLVRARDACPSGVSIGGVYRLLCEYAMRQLETDLHSVRVIDEMTR